MKSLQATVGFFCAFGNASYYRVKVTKHRKAEEAHS
jgi:hypothetical protein